MPTVPPSSSLTERRIIEIFRERFPSNSSPSDVVLGIGDDAAVTSLPAGRELVTATDALVEGTHFLPGASAASVGHRVLAVNLSDLAAMGAQAHWATLSLSLPDADREWVSQFTDAFAQLADEFAVTLVGGDTVRGPRSATVTIMGSVSAGRFVARSGAQVGDAIYLSGSPGFAAAGRALLAQELRCDSSAAKVYRHRFEFPQPRLALGAAISTMATAMIDISDGVHIDLERLLTASGVGAEAVIPDILTLTADFGLEVARELFLGGGEDYELCFCAPAACAGDIQAAAAEHEVPVSRIGTVRETSGLSWSQAGEPVTAGGRAFEHFQD